MEGEDVYAAARDEYRKVIREQRDEISKLKSELDRWLTCEEVRAMQAEIKRLRANQINGDEGDELVALRAEVERLVKSRNRWGRKYNALLEKHKRLRAENEAVLAANRDVMLHWDVLKADYERLRAALEQIAKVTYGWEPGVWSDEEARNYFASLFFGAQSKARAALGAHPAPGKEDA